ncbi:MAG: hypothetical protein EPN91_07485 [Salinibacterium sp.]|nr:MAG: hypothetical protein EPN91_07485 [Salinibacterium sp.]
MNVGRDPEARHGGDCYDGVYGCHLCWNAAHHGRGSVSNCDHCHRRTFTHVERDPEEPSLYAVCDLCSRIGRLGLQVDYADEDDNPADIQRAEDRLNAARRERDRLRTVPDVEADAIWAAEHQQQ